MKKILLLTLLTFSSFAIGENKMSWPELSEIPHTSGKAATEEDVNNFAAVFVLRVDGVSIGKAMNMAIPQYAYHTSEDGVKTKVIIIQAEEAQGNSYIGAKLIEEPGDMVGFLNEFTLLGTDVPKE